MKLPAGPLKVIFVSRPSLAENRRRCVSGAKGKLVPVFIVFVKTPAVPAGTDANGAEVPAVPEKVECFHAHNWRPTKLVPKTDFSAERPYPWIPTTRPGYPGESLVGTNVWLETNDELFIDTKDKTNG